jgi:hypothetical protein
LHLQGASVSYRIAMGPQQGQKVFTLQTLPASNDGEYGQLANTLHILALRDHHFWKVRNTDSGFIRITFSGLIGITFGIFPEL